MTLNCRYGRANAAAIVSAVKEHDVAVLALQELTDDLVAALDEDGLSDLLPYRQLGRTKIRTTAASTVFGFASSQATRRRSPP